MIKRIKLLSKSLALEIMLSLLLLFNSGFFFVRDVTYSDWFVVNIFTYIPLLLFSIFYFFIGFFVFFVSIREFFFRKYKFKFLQRNILLIVPYLIMNPLFFEMYSRYKLLNFLGFILLIVGLYLYFKVGLEKEPNSHLDSSQ